MMTIAGGRVTGISVAQAASHAASDAGRSASGRSVDTHNGRTVTTGHDAKIAVPGFRETALSFDVAPASHRLVIRVIDAASQVVLRSTWLKIPGAGAPLTGLPVPVRGLVVDTAA
jgi:hypothetical protein